MSPNLTESVDRGAADIASGAEQAKSLEAVPSVLDGFDQVELWPAPRGRHSPGDAVVVRRSEGGETGGIAGGLPRCGALSGRDPATAGRETHAAQLAEGVAPEGGGEHT